ncbi:type II secretion system F family protein [archaeon]|nr:type II secretion system F family protein [archaeon]
MANILIRLIDRVGEGTLTSAERVSRRAAELSIAFREQDEVAKTLLAKKREEEKEKKAEMEDRLSQIKDAVSFEPEEKKEDKGLELEREDLEVDFNERLINIISDLFAGFSNKGPGNFFTNIQEDLYKANIMMPAKKYIALSVGVAAISAAFMGILFAIILTLVIGPLGSIAGLLLGVFIFFIVLVIAKSQPKSKVKARSDAFSKEMPFALRHMSTQLTSGSGLLETMRSIAKSDYGVLSEEFKRALMEIERGATIEESFERMNLRIESPGLKKSSRQIISTLRTGGNLAATLKIIAEEIAREMRLKLKDYIQILNTFALMYMFVVVIAPVLITTLMVAMGIAMGGLLMPPAMMWLVYFVFFGIGIYMSIMIKRFEPKV